METQKVEKENKISHSTKLLYGLGAFGYGSIGQTMGSFLMFFGTSILGIPGVLMGIAVGLSTVWDATTDPIIGHMSDNTKSRFFGKRHGFILVGCFAVAITNLLIWSISPAFSVGAKFSLLLLLLLVIETFNTTYSTPYQALGLDLSKSYDERTVVQNYKTVFNFLSLLVPSLLMTVFLSPSRYVTMSAQNQGYVEIAVFTSSLCIICGLIVFFGTYKHRPIYTKQKQTAVSLVDSKPNKTNLNQKEQKTANHHQSGFSKVFGDFFAIIKQKNVGILIAGYAVSLSAGAFITSLGLHVFTYTFQFSTLEIPIIMMCLIGGIILGQPIWLFVSRKTDKVTALITALGTIITGMIIFSAILLSRNSIQASQVMPLVCAIIFICGIGTGCLYSLPISMFADCIYKHQETTGIDRTGKSAGFLTFCTKISNAFIMFIIGISLDVIGFRGNSAIQPLSTQNWLGWLLIAGVTISCIVAIFIYGRYSYSKKDF